MSTTWHALFSHPTGRRTVLRLAAALALAATITPQVLVVVACLAEVDAAPRAQIIVQGMEAIVALLAVGLAASAAYLAGLAGGVHLPARPMLLADQALAA